MPLREEREDFFLEDLESVSGTFVEAIHEVLGGLHSDVGAEQRFLQILGCAAGASEQKVAGTLEAGL